jgi:hypothetical protein
MSVAKKADAPQLEGVKPKKFLRSAEEIKQETEASDGVDEPEVRKPVVKPNAVPAKKTGKLAEVIGEWETDDE